MIRNLYINEELIVSLTRDERIMGIIKKEMLSKEIDNKGLQFIRNKASIMEQLKEGKDLEINTDGNNITSSISEITGVGFTVPSSIENLEFNLNARRR